MERRVFIAILLSFAVLYAYQALVTRLWPQPRPAERRTVSSPPAPQKATPPAPVAPAIEMPAAKVADSIDRTISVETPLVKVAFSNRGGVVTSWLLKKYSGPGNRPVDLVPQKLPADMLRPFSVTTEDQQLNARLATALFEPSATELNVNGGPQTLRLEYADVSGVLAEKEFTFSADSYVVKASIKIGVAGRSLNPTIHWGPGIGQGDPSESGYVQKPQGIILHQGTVDRVASLSEVRYEEPVSYAGVEDHYFLSAALPQNRVAVAQFRPVVVPPGDKPQLVAYNIRVAGGPEDLLYFVGPKDFDVLSRVGPDLVKAINYGWFAPLVVPLLRALKWINGYVGNYGWSIVILTILINAAMFPLRHKSVVSMRRMQELQPEVRAIQDRYAKLKTTDPARQKMNVELMNLYRERGVNPASGCIPILLTMPVLFAFYNLLSVAIEIRGAPFMLWIQDLSRMDPYYVTPILMGGTMFWQQKMTPTSMDPTQQKVMMFMPVMFTFFFLTVPSGLVLYWLMSNLWAIGQQYVTNRIIGPPVVREVRPPAERRIKRVGAGKSERAAKTSGEA